MTPTPIDFETWTELGFDPAFHVKITGFVELEPPRPLWVFLKEKRRWMCSTKWQIVCKTGERFSGKFIQGVHVFNQPRFYRYNIHDETVLKEYITEDEAKKVLTILILHGAQQVQWDVSPREQRELITCGIDHG